MQDKLTHSTPSTRELQLLAKDCRIEILKMLTQAQSGHPGGSLSAIDILVYLFFAEINMNTSDPYWVDRDRFILSKGHAVPALYTVFAKKGIIPQEELSTLRQLGSRLQGHPDRVLFPFVEASTGSLGQGLSVAQGIALGLKVSQKDARVFCLLGDGELQEGQVWEAAMSAPKFKLNHLTVIIDCNNGQIDGHTDEVMSIEPLAKKWEAFNWSVQQVDGHSFDELRAAFLHIKKNKTSSPNLIIARTVKGKGVSFMENQIGWHGVAPTKEQCEQAITELNMN